MASRSNHSKPARTELWAVVLCAVLGMAAGWWVAARAHQQAVEPAAVVPEDRPEAPAYLGQAIATRDDLDRLRAESIRAVFGADALPSRLPDAVEPAAPPMAGVATAERLTVQTAAGASYPLLLSAGHDRLAIYHAGHAQEPLRDAAEPIQALLAAGFDVLAMAMPGEPHDRMAELERPLQPFLEPVAVGLNHALAGGQYREVVMVGLSGGGWTTVVYSALDPRIGRSYPVAGSLPRRLRGERDAGDYEQALPGLPVGYLDLYLMASTDGRQQLQVFNRLDPCCFAGSQALSYADGLSARAQAFGGRFGVLVLEHDQHEVPPALLMLIRGL